MVSTNNVLVYEGCNFFRQRLVLATLSGRSVKIKRIRPKADNPGIQDFEASFIRLVDKVTNGSTIEVNETGTGVYYQPGMLIGGTVSHDCSTERSIGYYLEALLCLAPFMKKPLRVTLTGVTNSADDYSVDIMKAATLPLLKRFLGTDDGLELKVVKRGAAPGGGGEVLFACPARHKLRPLQLTKPSKVKRVRGVAWATRVSPATCNRMVEAARTVLKDFLPDIYIVTDHRKGGSGGSSPGFGLSLVAETMDGCTLGAERASQAGGAPVPEDMGVETARALLEEIHRGGVVDSNNQSLAFLMMTLGDKDISKVLTGPLTPFSIQYLRDMRDFFQITFKLEVQQNEEEGEALRLGGDGRVLATCMGVGFRNLSKVIS